jgi:imidazolonepropionase-like amidohydrolase
MRTALAILASVAILSCGAPRSVATARQPELVITGATLIDGTGALPRSGITIVLREGRVAAVTPDAEAERFERATVIDAAGTYVIPGLADMHVHFGLGVPLRRQSTTTDEVLARELYYGVTTILQLGATDGSTEMIRSLKARRVAGTLRAPYIYGTGGHLTLHGTHPVYTIFPTDVRRAADSLAAATPLADPVNLYPLGLGISIVRTEAAARSAVRERAEGGMAAIKITVESGPTTFGDDHPQMSVEMIRPIVDEAARHDLPVFAHISSRDELEAVLEGGAAGVVHTVWDDPLPDTALADQMRAAGFAVVPTLALYAGAISLGYVDEPVDLGDPFLRATVSDEEVAALRDPTFLARYRRGRALSRSGSDRATEIDRRMTAVVANVGMLHDRGVTIVVGTDTSNP